ncbi:MAG: HEAT repeat domain-containing protein, partial [Elainellaceae cyanobacterium]
AAEALGAIGSEAAIPGLLKVIEHSDEDVRRTAVESLGAIGSEAVIPGLIKALKVSNWKVRRTAAEALGAIGSEAVIPSLLKALEDSDAYVRRRAAESLGAIGSGVAIPRLLKAIEDSDYYVRKRAAEALGQFKHDCASHCLPLLFSLLPTRSGQDAYRAIQGIQANCKFYNYEIWQAHLAAQTGDNSASQSSSNPITYEINAEVVQIVEKNHGTIHGKQTP